MREYAQIVAEAFDPIGESSPRSSPVLGLTVSLLVVTVCTGLLYPLSQITPAASNGVIYILGVLVVSTYYGLWCGLFTSLSSAIAFNFFHIPPTGTFDIAKSENWVALVVFLIVALLASSLAEQSRGRAREAERRRREATAAEQVASALLADSERLQKVTIETEALRRSDEMKTALLRTVSHDLRSPLTAIIAAGEALTSERIEANDRIGLATAVTVEAARLAGLVEKLLDLSRLEAGQAQPRSDWCSIEEVVAAAVEDLGERGGLVSVSLDRDLPFIRADSAQLERALSNLLENAIRYSAGEQSLIRGRALADRIVIRVVDRGPGITPGELEHVFEPFYQAADQHRHEGAGLGLAIVRGLVEVNGGRVWAESVPGQGSTFVIEMPLELAHSPPTALAGEIG